MHAQLGDVTAWYDEHGTGDPLVLLHPGGADARAFGPNLDALASRFHVFTPERRGHGHTPDVAGPISYAAMAQDTVAFLETTVGGPAHLVGHSDGAVVALLTALSRPDLVRDLVLASGVFHHDGWADGVLDADEETVAFMAAGYGEISPDGIDHYPTVVAKLDRMHAEEPTLTQADLSMVRSRTLVLVGDDDEVRFDHTIAAYQGIANAELAVIPGTSHGLLVEKPALCNQVILDFLTVAPIPTLAPIRRR